MTTEKASKVPNHDSGHGSITLVNLLPVVGLRTFHCEREEQMFIAGGASLSGQKYPAVRSEVKQLHRKPQELPSHKYLW